MENDKLAIPDCFAQYLTSQRITEKQDDKYETIGHMTVCLRRFQKDKPGYITDYIQALGYALPECRTCCRELTSFRKSIAVDFSKTKRTKEQIRIWISEQVRKGCRNFAYDPHYKDRCEMLPNPATPVFGDYTPDAYIEPEAF
jgi:hypothetical protein